MDTSVLVLVSSGEAVLMGLTASPELDLGECGTSLIHVQLE